MVCSGDTRSVGATSCVDLELMLTISPKQFFAMIRRDQLPDDAVDWNNVSVSFPRLAEDSADSCPESENRIFEYIQVESADLDAADRSRLRFVRTARIADARFWLWEYSEEDGELQFVVFRQRPDGSTLLGLSSPNGLSHEQYLLANYYDEIYWS